MREIHPKMLVTDEFVCARAVFHGPGGEGDNYRMGKHLLQVGCWAFQEVGVMTVLNQTTELIANALFPALDVTGLWGSPAGMFHTGKNRGKLRDGCGKTSIGT